MIENNDWRLQGQEKYLTGVKLIRTPFAPLSKTWDHEHCDFCFATFSDYDGDLHEGYCTEPSNTATSKWICPECYADFKEYFGWVLCE